MLLRNSVLNLLAIRTRFTPSVRKFAPLKREGRSDKTLTRISKFTLFTKKFFPLPEVEGKVGFTLAEVLITLGIIGVVAALTLPNGVIVPPNLEATRNTNLANCKRKVVCDGEVNNSGHQECSTLIYKDGWKISPDYPW